MLLFESMLDSVLVARDKWLAPNGILAPSHSSMHMALISSEEYIFDKFDFWRDCYGFKMDVFREDAFLDAQIEVLHSREVASDSCLLQNLNLSIVSLEELNFTSSFSLTFKEKSSNRMHGFVVWFDILFDGTMAGVQVSTQNPKVESVQFTTSPYGIPTHWKQTLFILKEGLDVKVGDEFIGTIKVEKSPENPRELITIMSYSHKSLRENGKTSFGEYQNTGFVR